MVVRLEKKSWWVDISYHGQRHRERSPENSRAGAKIYESVIRQRLALGEPLRSQKDASEKEVTFEEFSNRWLKDYVKANNKSSEQYRKERTLETSLIPFFGKMHIGEIKGNYVEQYKVQELKKGLSRKSVNNRLAILQKCLNCAHEWLDVEIPKIKMLKCSKPTIDYLTISECEQLLAHAEGQMLTMLLLALRSGMRQGELRALQWSSIDWEQREIIVRHSLGMVSKELETTKSHKERRIPMDIDVYERLYRARKASGYVFLSYTGKAYTGHRILDELKQVCEKASLRNIGWHTLRHSFATHLSTKGVPMPIVQALLGHATIATTMQYFHIASEPLRAAIDVLNPKSALTANIGQPAVNQQPQQKQDDGRFASLRPI